MERLARRIERGRGEFMLPERLRAETNGAIDSEIVPTREDRWQPAAPAARQPGSNPLAEVLLREWQRER